MSIKNLFDKRRDELPQTTNQEMLENVESTQNLLEKSELKTTFVPQIDYSEPENFTKYGSALLYYKSAIERIYNYFPYDGSDAEINSFTNKSLPHERYIFENLYPRTNGYANFNGSSYVSLKGGPHATSYDTLGNLFRSEGSTKRTQANLYETNIYDADNKPSDYSSGTRESNLKSNFQTGVTVEFWLKAPAPASNTKQSIFHLTNSSGGDALTIFLSGTTGSPFHVSLDNSGTSVFANQQIGSSPTTSSIEDWSHYAVSFRSASSGISTRLYVNGKLDSTNTLGSAGVDTLTQKGTIAYIASGSAGYLSGSIDEFRFWKAERNGFQIGSNYFTQVRGGSNTDTANATLGVYYKFNEGTTNIPSLDEVVLDYAGRITNGTWNGTVSRTLESAIVEAGAAATEYKDPIIYEQHPSVSSLKEDLESKGSFYDSNNPTRFVNYLPSWVVEQSENDEKSQLEVVSHIIGSYFDKVYLQIQAVSEFKQPLYTSSSYKPLPFARHLPQSLGLYTPEIFVDSDIINTIANKTENFNFETDLEDTKNLIYLNLYNNLASIFKSKGTEKSIKGILRCFYVDDQIIKLNTYSNKARYELRNNLEQTTKLNKYVNFNNSSNVDAVIYQKQDPSDTTNTIGYLSGSESEGYEFAYGATVEADITFPYFNTTVDVIDRRFNEVSLFGVVSASVDSPDDTTFLSTDNTNFQVFAVRETEKSKNAYFKLTSSISPNPFPQITSSVFFGVYNNQDWNFSVSIIPNKSGSLKFVTGSDDYAYTLRFEGNNTLLGDVRDSFSIDETLTKTQGENFLKSAKRVYAGAYRDNLTGSLVNKSDVLVSGVRYWLKSIDQNSKKQHALDFDNVGRTDSYQNISSLDSTTKDLDVLNKDTLALSWEFSNLSSSDSGGNFYITDFSSGSALVRDNYGWVGSISGYQHSAYGFGFAASSSDIIDEQRINVFKFVDPERTISSDMVTLVDDSQELYGIPKDIVGYHHTLEKSMYSAISDEMLKFFAGAADFNNLIGEPVNRYRMDYKALEKLRQAFFLRVENVKEVERYIEYYKWFDDSLGDIIKQLVPASAVVSENVFDVVESHVLERNKYQSKFPTIEFKPADPESPALGIREKTYDWERGHHPVSNSQRENSEYWQKRANREDSDVISSGDNTVDQQRDGILETADKYNTQKAPTISDENRNTYSGQTYVLRKLSRPYKLNIDRRTNPPRIIKGGTNFEVNKNFGYHRTALHPAGPVNRTNGVFVPKNVLLGFTEDLVELENTTDPQKNPNVLIKRNIKIQSGRDWEDGVGYKNMKSDIVFPFNIVSSSVTTGYNKQVVDRVTASVEIVNLHNDVYGDDMERPMQGPFTDYAVGGLQNRHTKLNDGNDSYLNRPEAWKIALGLCEGVTGAIGMIGPDYPYPEANAVGANPYPMTGAQKAYLYRDMVAKRPVNIRNIHHTTGSTILGNYNKNYDVVQAGSAFSTPRQFVDKQPDLPATAFSDRTRYATSVRTLLDINRNNGGHNDFNGDYSAEYLHSSSGDSVIISRFSAPGGIEVMTRGYQDFRSSTYSVYNALNARNQTVRRTFQGVSSSIVSETSGMRNFDHTGRDFGLTNLSARHSARFFRDSTLETNPGTSYDEKPSFHRVHRNNIIKPREVISTVQAPSGLSLTNSDALYFINRPSGQSAAASQENQVLNYLTGSRASGSTFSGWIRTVGSVANNRIFTVGRTPGSAPFIRIYKGGSGGNFLYLEVVVNDSGLQKTNKWSVNNTDLSDGDFHHIVVSFNTSLTASTTNFYIDGVKQTTIENDRYNNNFWTTPDASYNFRSFGNVNGTRYYVIGNDSGTPNGTQQLSGAVDQVSVWTTQLTDAEVESLYNSGNPYNITASSVYTDNSSNLHAWWTFETSSGDAINTSNPGTYNASTNVFNDHSGNDYDLFAIATNGTTIQLDLDNGSTGTPSPVAGDSSTTSVEVTSYVCDEKNDNLFVNHQIPRSDRQYSWISNSIVTSSGCQARYSGFMKTGINKPPIDAPYYVITGTYVPFFDYVSASEPGSAIYQNTTRLNLLITDETGSEQNVLGVEDLEITSLTTLPEHRRLNALLVRRGDLYGWNWTGTRQQNHPILRIEKQENKLTAFTNGQLTSYDMKPVNMSGRPVYLSVYKTTQTQPNGATINASASIEFKASYNNYKQGFADADLQNISGLKTKNRKTNLEDFMMMINRDPQYVLNWVVYSENIFPSQRNAFDTDKTFRNEYDNQYWRYLQDDREVLGNTLSNSFGVAVSQSSWILDAVPDFNNRVAPPITADLKVKGGGELQNTYFHYFDDAPPAPSDGVIREALTPSALYARKHLMPTYKSVVTPSGIRIPQTGSSHTSLVSHPINVFGGEARWEAGAKAGVVDYSGDTPLFVNKSSEPWFNNYSDFKSELKAISKDHAIIPEFRISEKVSTYLKAGTNGVGAADTFEIVGTPHDSDDDNFYKDYSNSEFLKEFANISEITDTTPKEIRLVCKAVTRFNPYKGFYPAQRTIDMVEQFAESYENSFAVSGLGVQGATGRDAIENNGSLMRPLLQPLFAPGILYNTIKSGIGVDFPVITTPKKKTLNSPGTSIYALAGEWDQATSDPEKYLTGQYWNKRLPFETILDPDRHLLNIQLFDMEPHPSASLNATASFFGQSTDQSFKKMSNNFFAEVADFFLKDSEYTTLKSGIVEGTLNFESGSFYGARLKIKRSTKGDRTYDFDYDKMGNQGSTGTSGFAQNGLRVSSSFGFGTSSIQLPQDPKDNPRFKETFTMYSRPTAFGPAVWGRDGASISENSGALDSLVGYNWSFTPPYYHGESWADLIFYPDHTKSYTLEQILAEIEVRYWRADKGYSQRKLMPTGNGVIYSADNINANAMQLDSVLNLFGVENIPFEETNESTLATTKRNTTVAQRWVIQPKAETPMMNFSDEGVNEITTGRGYSLSPTYASESVPRGMWHQFGNMPEDPSKGIFLEIGDIPTNWLQFHPSVTVADSIYNNQDATNNSGSVYQNMKSLTDLLGFENSSTRLGELKESQTIREAIVAIPYITIGGGNCNDINSQASDAEQKQFFSIPRERVDAAIKVGSLKGDADTSAGDSIRDLIANVKEYVLPPEFDFVADPKKLPLVMYFFEFEYKLDKDDLSYIWQNLAPRNYKQMAQVVQKSAHKLAENELLQPEDIIENKNLRWMVFKVKQRGMAKYEEKTYRQAGTKGAATQTSGYEVNYNWPYDYVSFVEMINMDVEVLMDDEVAKTATKAKTTTAKVPKFVDNTKIRDGLEQVIVQKALNMIDDTGDR